MDKCTHGCSCRMMFGLQICYFPKRHPGHDEPYLRSCASRVGQQPDYACMEKCVADVQLAHIQAPPAHISVVAIADHNGDEPFAEQTYDKAPNSRKPGRQ
jgi:hypothetical protein